MTQAIKRCTGHCCKSFYLPFTKEQIDGLKNGGSRKNYQNYSQPDFEKIIGMVFPVEVVNGIQKWSCKYYDKFKGNCLIYDERPTMCSDYPYGLDCKIEGCTMKNFK